MRRVVDLAIAIPALVLVAPLLAGLAVLVRRDSPGPAIFRQVRIGRDGVPFIMFKLRSMRSGPATVGGTVMGGAEDPRVTRVGRLLRSTHLDELPQLVNVIRGDMTLIGPRPEIPEFVERYSAAQREVLRVRPGITGPGQVEYATRWEPLLDAASDPNEAYVRTIMGPKLDLELAYLRRRSLGSDLGILAGTVRSLLRVLTRS